MHPIAFQVGNFMIYSHGLLAAVGILIGSVFINWQAKKARLVLHEYWDMILYVVLTGLLGARLGYFIVHYSEFNSFLEIFYIWQGGLLSYTGLIFGFGFAAWFLYLKKALIWPWLDIGMLGVLLGWSIARVGCFLAADVIGKTTQANWGIIIPAVDHVRRHPVALYESLGVLIVFGTLWYLYQKKKTKPGDIFLLGTAGYALVRFIVDFWRQYSFFNTNVLSLSQIVSLIILILAFGVLIYRKKVHLKKRGSK